MEEMGRGARQGGADGRGRGERSLWVWGIKDWIGTPRNHSNSAGVNVAEMTIYILTTPKVF